MMLRKKLEEIDKIKLSSDKFIDHRSDKEKHECN